MRAEPLLVDRGEEAVGLHRGQVLVDLGEQRHVLQTRVDADVALAPGLGDGDVGLRLGVVAQRRQWIDHRVDALVLEIVHRQHEIVVELDVADVILQLRLGVALAARADLQADGLALEVFRLADAAVSEHGGADARIVIRFRERDLLGALGRARDRRNEHIGAFGDQRRDDSLEIDDGPLDLDAHAAAKLVGKINVEAGQLAVRHVLERRIGAAVAGGHHAFFLDGGQRIGGQALARAAEGRHNRECRKRMASGQHRHHVLMLLDEN